MRAMAEVDEKILPDTVVLPSRTIVRPGAVEGLADECLAFGERGILVHGRSLERNGVLERILGASPDTLGLKAWRHPGGEPTLAQLDDLLRTARGREAEWIAAVGGGSVLDIAKACAGLLHASLSPVAYHNGAEIETSRVPFVAVPTTGGTGSEATIVSVLTDEEKEVKKSIRHFSFMASLVILDPELTASCPGNVVACSGMDAFTQAVESFVSVHATWLSEEFSLKAMALIASGIEAVFDGERGDKAQDLLVGSYLAGLALSNAGLGIVHGLAHPLGIRYHAPHGLVCALCLPPALEFNRKAMGEKYLRMSCTIGADLFEKTRYFIKTLKIESPFAGQTVRDRQGIVLETLESGSTRANPRPVTEKDVEFLLEKIFYVDSRR